MNSENIVIAHPTNHEQTNAIKAFLKALKIKFEVKKEEEVYNDEFVAKINKSRQDYKNGHGTVVTLDQLNDLCK